MRSTTRSLSPAIASLLIVGCALAIALLPDFALINPYGWPQIWEFLQAALQPDLGAEFLQVTWRAAWVTLSYAIIGTVISLVLGFFGACLTSYVVARTIFPGLAATRMPQVGKVLLTIPRSLHEVIWGLLLINWVGLDPIAGILAIAIPYSAIVAKIFAEILDDTPRDALESLLAAGSHPTSAIAFGLLPRAKLSLISYGFYRFECSLRSAAILGIIGAGGLGYQMMLSLDSLRYSQLWTLFYAIFILNGSVDLLSACIRHQIGAPKRFELKPSLQNNRAASQAPNRSHWLRTLLLPVISSTVLILAWVNLSPHINKLWRGDTAFQWPKVSHIFSSAFSNVEMFGRLPWLSLQTLAMSVLAIAIAGIGAFILSWFAALSLGQPETQLELTASQRLRVVMSHTLLLIMRAIPSPIWALVFLYLFRPGIMVGAIALGVHNMGVLGRLFAEDIENADGRGLQSIRNAGGAPVSQVLYGLVPVLVKRSIHYSAYRWEVCLRESFVLALVGAGGLGILLKEAVSSFDGGQIVLVLILFWVFTVGIEYVSGLAKTAQKGYLAQLN